MFPPVQVNQNCVSPAICIETHMFLFSDAVLKLLQVFEKSAVDVVSSLSVSLDFSGEQPQSSFMSTLRAKVYFRPAASTRAEPNKKVKYTILNMYNNNSFLF